MWYKRLEELRKKREEREKSKEKRKRVKIVGWPVVNQNVCTGCEECVDACKAGAIVMVKNKSKIDYKKCYDDTCDDCIQVCPSKAIFKMD